MTQTKTAMIQRSIYKLLKLFFISGRRLRIIPASVSRVSGLSFLDEK